MNRVQRELSKGEWNAEFQPIVDAYYIGPPSWDLRLTASGCTISINVVYGKEQGDGDDDKAGQGGVFGGSKETDS